MKVLTPLEGPIANARESSVPKEIEGCPVANAFDPYSEAYLDDPAQALRSQGRIFYSVVLDAFVVTNHDDVRAVYRDTRSFSSRRFSEPVTPLCPAARRTLTVSGFEPSSSLATTDGPLHIARRRRLDELFRREAVRAWEPRMREVYAAQLDPLVGRGSADLVADLFWEPPALLAMEFMGVHGSEAAQLKAFAAGLLEFVFGRPTDDEQVEICRRMVESQEFARRLVDRLMADASGPGLLPFAARVALAEPELFDRQFLISLVTNTLTAAHETTTSALTNAMLLLLRRPDAWRTLAADGGAVAAAVEECLRAGPPLTTGRRLCVTDTVIGDVNIPAGSMVLLGVASANVDPAVFDAPDELDIGRSGAQRHLTFGFGSHYCLGAPFARMQMQVALGELSRRLPHLELVPDQPLEYVPSLSVWTPRQLHVRWDAQQNALTADSLSATGNRP